MAVIGNSYLYHMRNVRSIFYSHLHRLTLGSQDLIAYIQPGVAQNMGENALALLHYLASSESPITTLPEHPPRPTTVYFSHLGRFWMYSFGTAKVCVFSLLNVCVADEFVKIMYSALLLVTIFAVRSQHTSKVCNSIYFP